MKLIFFLIFKFVFINRSMVLCTNTSQSHVLHEGESCTFNNTTQGVCKYMFQCPIAQDQLGTKKICPVVCGFSGITPIVCCPRPKPNFLRRKRENVGDLAMEYCLRNAYSSSFSMIIGGGGVNSYDGEFSSMVAVGWPLVDDTGYAWNCGGTLITEYYVLTAGHCTTTNDPQLKTNNPTIVKLGTVNLKQSSSSSLDAAIAEIYVHPDYKPPIKYNDIALLRLTESVRNTDTIKPACLIQSNDFSFVETPRYPKNYIIKPTSEFNGFGWGETGNSKSSDILQKVTLKLVDNIICNAGYKGRRSLPKGIINSQFCAGANGTQDMCRGDSGGPLAILTDSGYFIAGVTSFGIGCLGVQIPGVYTRVSYYIDWIENIVWA